MTAAVHRREDAVVWHDLECGAYEADLALWLALAEAHGDPVLDVGAGTGRVALALARAGHRVIALDRDPRLIAELRRRAGEIGAAASAAPRPRAIVGEAERLAVDELLRLVIMPMQTIQLLPGEAGRRRFLRAARERVRPGAALAIAITEDLEPFDGGHGILPAPDERRGADGLLYRSQPTAIVEYAGHGFALHRRREVVADGAVLTCEDDVVVLESVTAARLEREASAAGWRPLERLTVDPTTEHVGATVVVMRAH